ncbi:MAG: glycosyltransferase family 2 protein [Candidatus Omnitrophica bacterium]|nr:glycosyltransferase family 2 protein [Candidatus Omnitrophota bacterium]
MKISVILCTYNRGESLRITMDSLVSQENIDSFDWEIIIADNNSSDQTKEIIESYKDNFGSRLRYIFESKKGKCHALNKAIKESQGDIIALSDDDVIMDKSWLQNIHKFAQENDFDAFGGRILPAYPENAPRWVTENIDILCGAIVVYDYGTDIKPYDLVSMAPLVGANMVVKRKVFDEIGLYNVNLGPGAGTLGDDTEFCRRLEAANKKIYYFGDALVWHPVARERMTLNYITSWTMAVGRYLVVKKSGKVDENIVWYFGMPRYLFGRMLKNFLFLLIQFPFIRKFLRRWIDIFLDVGMLQQYRRYYKKVHF